MKKEHAMATQSNPAAATESKAATPNHSVQRTGMNESVLRPPVDIYETPEELVLRADMPGVTRDRLQVRIDGNNLLIEGSIGISPQEAMTAVYADIRSTVYQRQFVLSNELDTANIGANLQNGVLTVKLPKRAEHKPRRIPVG
jgi:HSP20 family molecular chaperone IbpA